MGETILFWDFFGWREGHDRPTWVVAPEKHVAEDLNITRTELNTAFRAWKNTDYPEEYTHKIEPKKWIRIRYHPSFSVGDGLVRTIRPWGKGTRTLSDQHYPFTLEATI